MIIPDMTYHEIAITKNDIREFLNLLEKVSSEQGNELQQIDIDFFSFLAKQIVFLKDIYSRGRKVHMLAVLISDYYNYILSIVKNEHRYIYLNERSMIENYMRLILYKMVEDDFHVGQLLTALKEKFPDIMTPDDFSLLKNEYSIASNYIHGGNQLSETLAFYFENCLCRNVPFRNKNTYYENIKKLLKLSIKLLIRKYSNIIDGVFHRRKSLLEYLLGKMLVDFLFLERDRIIAINIDNG